MDVGAEQLREFAENGYLVLHGVVDAGRVEAALTAINHWLGAGFESAELE